MSLYSIFRNLFILRATRDPMIGLAWWLWGKTPATFLAKTAVGLLFVAAFRYRRELRPYVEDPYKSISAYINKFSERRKR